ncbi:hypothetical protein [Nesterenkonia flava]|uniref:SpaA-like prealbumin fold domain-containing protein n=1 Tax=Nesterenkonia flava TaxID=469799 RepID=A0ABU1FQ51_9MICC|nr:hypothetical protein [Nesterenkonia flava]MDR5710734.1 hypothetical protein [Nesterenkonia flava]
MAQQQTHPTSPHPRASRLTAIILMSVLVGAGIVLSMAQPAAASGTLSLFKAIENLDTGASEGDRSKWGVRAVNIETGQVFEGDGLNGFQSRRIPAGQYRISEFGTDRTPAGYAFRDWRCGGQTYTDPQPTVTLG